MIIPVRCFTCGKVVGAMWEDFKQRTDNGEDPSKVMDDLGLTRMCCRRLYVAQPYDRETKMEPVDEVIPFT